MHDERRSTAAVANERRRGERRRRRVFFLGRERRSGFDRRRPEDASKALARYRLLLRGLRDEPPMLVLMLFSINLLNLADFSLTLDALARGAGEANPVMRVLLDAGSWAGGLFKMSVVMAVSLAVWRFRRYRLVLEAGLFALVVFGAVLVYQVVGRLLI